MFSFYVHFLVSPSSCSELSILETVFLFFALFYSRTFFLPSFFFAFFCALADVFLFLAAGLFASVKFFVTELKKAQAAGTVTFGPDAPTGMCLNNEHYT